jgi:hypothetical protein
MLGWKWYWDHPVAQQDRIMLGLVVYMHFNHPVAQQIGAIR